MTFFAIADKLDLNPTFIEVTSKTICLNILRKIIRIIRKILKDNIEFHYLNPTLYHCLDDLLYITTECELGLKLAVLETIFTATQHIKRDRHSLKFIEYFEKFAVYLEQIVYEIFNNKFELNVKERNTLESVLITFNESVFYAADTSRKIRISEFILKNHERLPNFSKTLLEKYFVLLRNSVAVTEKVDEIITKVFTNGRVELLCLIERQLRLKNATSVALWKQVVAALKQNWRETKCTSGCALAMQLLLFEEVGSMAVRLNLSAHFVDCLEEFAKCGSQHFSVCGRSVSGGGFFNCATNCLMFSPPQKWDKIYRLPLQPLGIGPYALIHDGSKDLGLCVRVCVEMRVSHLEALKGFRKCLDLLLLRQWEGVSEVNSHFVNILRSIEKVCVTEETASVVSSISRPLFTCPNFSSIRFSF